MLLLIAKVRGGVANVLIHDTNQLAIVLVRPELLGITEGTVHHVVRKEDQDVTRLSYTLIHALRYQSKRMHIVPDACPGGFEKFAQVGTLILSRGLAVIDEVDILQLVFGIKPLNDRRHDWPWNLNNDLRRP